MTRAALLDRDGTLIRDVGYLSSPEQIEWLPGAIDAIARLKGEGCRVIVLTNQSGIARGILTSAELATVHRELQRQLSAAAGVKLDAFFSCPHHPDVGTPEYRVACRCRKPLPGMFERAIRELAIEPERSMAAGDGWRDLVGAWTVGVRDLYLIDGDGPGPEPDPAPPVVRCSSLAEAVELWLGRASRQGNDDAG